MNTAAYNRRTIVAIDDSQMIRSFLNTYMEKDFNIRVYASGSDAVADIIANKINPECVVTDYNMPQDISGLEVLKRVKSYDDTLPVVFLSGSCNMTQRLECFREGANDFVSKPFNPRELVARVNNAISLSEKTRARLRFAG